MVDLLAPLHRHFGHVSFRAGQEDLVQAVLEGRDVLAVMPTGSGKSLGFQLPAVLLPGTTLVVSPLIALMKDQVDELNRRGIRAAAAHSLMPADARREAIRAARDGRLQLLYVAPERFASEQFVQVLGQLAVARFVVDEAHCVSEWGHDFRPDYRRLRAAAEECRRSDGQKGRPPIAAFTATATPEVRDDIVGLLGLTRPRVIVAGFDRPNIYPSLRPVAGEYEKQDLLPQLIGERRALVYTATRNKAEVAADGLRTAAIRAAAYHGGLSDTARTRVQEAFASGDLRVVCATNAFGMGIDRPDIDAVIHADVPGSIEAYYQEIGRAGRDGRPATATLLWNYADVKTREFLIDHGRDEEPGRPSTELGTTLSPSKGRHGVAIDPVELKRRKQLEHKKLRRMVAYASTTACLRATILRYFGDPAAREPCGTCGNCDCREPLDEAGRLFVRKILSGIARAPIPYGRRKIAAMLAGNTDGLPEMLTRLSTTGLLRSYELRLIERWIDSACAAGFISVSADQYRTLTLTPVGREVMAGRVDDVRMNVPRALGAGAAGRRRRSRMRGLKASFPAHVEGAEGWKAGRHPSSDWEAVDGLMATSGVSPPPSSTSSLHIDTAVVKALRAWRLEEARRRAIAPFVILHDRTLTAIATARPRSTAELKAISGIGPRKIAEYGEAILSVVSSIVGELKPSG
jgi:ATP-dependent DNA helicase RecQ